jgi:hypothetical protein
MFPPARKTQLKLLVCLSVAFLAPAGHAQASGQKPPQAVADMLNQQVWWDSASPTDSNPKGQQLQFSKIDEVTHDGKRFVRYRVYLSGAPEGKKYLLQLWKIGTGLKEMQTVSESVYVNAKGLLMTSRPRSDQENEDSAANDGEVELALRTARGEPARFVLSIPNKKFLVPGVIVPYPIESSDGLCRLEARLASNDGEAILLYGDGLPPDSVVPLESSSENEAHTASLQVDDRGHAGTVVLPYVIGKDAGVLKASITISGCSVSVEIPWGSGTYSPL